MRLFNGFYTIRNRQTGEHRTFRIATQAEDARFAPGERIVSLLVGQDNSHDYKGFGFVKKDESGIVVWKKLRSRDMGKPSNHEMFAKMIWALSAPEGQGQWWKDRYELMLSKRCVRCNRRLTNPESVESGIGPDCAGRGSNRPVVDPEPDLDPPSAPAPVSEPAPAGDAYDPDAPDPELEDAEYEYDGPHFGPLTWTQCRI
jgi:hypothetical protein